MELTPCAIEAVNTNEIDPIDFIIGRNLNRRHIAKLERARILVRCIRAKVEQAEEAGDISRQDGEKIPGRGRKPNRVKAEALAAKPLDISRRAIERAMGEKAECKKPKPKPPRQSVKKEGERFAIFLLSIREAWGPSFRAPSDAVLDRLAEDQNDNASGIETLKIGEAWLAKIRKRMEERQR